MDFLKRCNGYRFGADNIEAGAVKAAFLEALPAARAEFRAFASSRTGAPDCYEFGPRFYHDRAVWSRAASAGTREEIAGNPRAWALDALRDCASADHWYTYTKEW